MPKATPKTFFDFLNLLLSFGPKLPQAFAIIDRLVNDAQELIELFTGQPLSMAAAPLELNGAEAAKVAEVETALASDGVDRGPMGGVLMNLWTFIQAHPELLTLLLSLLTKTS